MNNLALIQVMCADSTRMIGGSWYVSAMIMAMLFVYPMLKTYCVPVIGGGANDAEIERICNTLS